MEYEPNSAFVVTFKPPTHKFIFIKGKMKPGSSRFDLNLVCMPSGDRALHCSFRLDERRVVRNHSTGNPSCWGEEEVVGEWSIKESGKFDITILNKENIKIWTSNGTFEFPHRLPFSKITHINGSVGADITCIEFDDCIGRFA